MVQWNGEKFYQIFFYIFSIGLFQKKTKRGVEKIGTFLEKNPGNFSFPTLPLEISDKTKLHLWELHKIVLRRKTKNFGNSSQFVLDHPWTFPVVFNYITPGEIPLSISSVPPGNSISPPPSKLSK